MEVGVLFADIRGFTAWSSSQPASEAARRIAEFYDEAFGANGRGTGPRASVANIG